MNYSIVTQDGKSVITFFSGEGFHTAGSDHLNFESIVEAVKRGDAVEAVRLLDPVEDIVAKFDRVGERVTVAHGTLYFDGDPIDGVLATEIVELYRVGKDYGPLVRFMEKAATNPNSASVDQLYAWMKNRSFAITNDGDILGYKGVYNYNAESEEGDFKSCSAGTAIVNGRTIKGQIPQKVGDIVEMPRNKVTFDPTNGCGAGLHVGTKDYAEGYGNTLIMVKVNPRDVVSVPDDSAWQKLRVCRYEVVDVFDTRYDDTSVALYGWDYNSEEPTPFILDMERFKDTADSHLFYDVGYQDALMGLDWGATGERFGVDFAAELSDDHYDAYVEGFDTGLQDRSELGLTDPNPQGFWN